METGVEREEAGVGLSRRAGNSVREIRDAQSLVTKTVDEIGLSLKEQAAATHDIASRVERVTQGTEELAATAKQSRCGAEEMQHLAAELNKLASRFRVA